MAFVARITNRMQMRQGGFAELSRLIAWGPFFSITGDDTEMRQNGAEEETHEGELFCQRARLHLFVAVLQTRIAVTRPQRE